MDVGMVEIHEAGPREGMQFEGMGDWNRIAVPDKSTLVDVLRVTGIRKVQVMRFVSSVAGWPAQKS